MDEKGFSYLVASEEKNEISCPMYFGVSCAFFALKVLSRIDKNDESQRCEKMLIQLLGLLVWRIQRGTNTELLLHKLEIAEKQIKELKQIRHEDAKANEKVVGIFASQEQTWFIERKKLRQQIGALMNELRVLQKRKEEDISKINHKLKEMELLVESKDKALEEEKNKRGELEEKLTKSENIADQLRETAKREAQEYSTDLWKYRTTFLELVSNQRQLEAELGRALRQLEAKRQEIDLLLEKKEESVLLSMEIAKMRKDLEQKDQILSAMLRKSKLDTAEKQVLLKEVKLSKAKRKQEISFESKHERHSLRSMYARQSNSRSHDPSIARGSSQNKDYVLEFRKDAEMSTPISHCYSSQVIDELAITSDAKRLEESEEYAASIEKRHSLEIYAFSEQLRLKDEKLEGLRWRMLSMEVESKRLQSHVEGLNREMSQLRNDNMELEALLLERQEELNAFKEQFAEKKELELSVLDVENVKIENMNQENFTEMGEEKDEDADEGKAAESSISISQSPEKELEDRRRMDLQALGVSYKIKRLKQQLLMLERLTENNEMMNLLNKQVSRYESLNGKTDELCRRMHDNEVEKRPTTKSLQHFLEETFELQRYMVATGQKLMEVQSKIGVGVTHTKRFADHIRTLFREIQRGLELRIARIIGDLEGTLTCQGIINMSITCLK